MKKLRTLALATSLLAAAGGAYVVHQRATSTAGGSGSAVDRALRFELRWPRGTSYTYSFDWTSESRVSLPELGERAKGLDEGGIRGDASLAGEVVLRSHGKRGNAYVLSARISKLRRHVLHVFGKDVLPSDDVAAQTLQRDEAYLVVDGTGAVSGVYFEKEAQPLFKHLMQGLVTRTQVSIRANGVSSWDAAEATSVGTGDAHYEVRSAAPPVIVRTRAEYREVFALPQRTAAAGDQRLHARAEIRLDPRGLVATIRDEEQLLVQHGAKAEAQEVASKTTFALDLLDVSPGGDSSEEVDLARLEVRRIGVMAGSQRAPQQILEQRAAGVTFADVSRQLASFALTGSVADSGWLDKAAAFLKLHPSHCMDLAALFDGDTMTDRGRAQILDLLAGTGTPQAQDAMRIALEGVAGRISPAKYGAFLERFALVSHPTADTLELLAGAFDKAPVGESKLVAAYALGAAAGNALKNGDRVSAHHYSQQIQGALSRARSPEERRHLVAALGNTGLDENVPELRKLAHDDDPGVRGAAAWALRDSTDRDARAVLVDLASDAEPAVAERAFEALAQSPIRTEEFARLAESVASGATPAGADGALLTLLSAHPEGGEPAAAMLRVMLARNDADKSMQARIRHVLASLRART